MWEMSRRDFIKISGTVAAMAIGLSGCAQPSKTPTTTQTPSTKSSAGPYDLRMLTFLPGSGWHVYATAMADIWSGYLPQGSKIDVVPTPLAGIPTPILVGVKKEYNISLMQSDIAGWAYNGRTDIWPDYPEEGIKNIRVLTALMDRYTYGMAVTKDFAEKYDVWTVEDLVEKKPPIRLRTLPSGAGGELRARLVLKEFGLSYDDIKAWGGEVVHADFKTNITAIMDGHADSLWHVIVKGHPAWTELTTMVDMVFLSMGEELINSLVKKYNSLPTAIEPDWGFKGVTKEVPTDLGWTTVLIVRDDMPNEIAYSLIKALDENREKLFTAAPGLKNFDPKESWKPEYRSNVPLHPGAETYFKEKGYM